MIVYYYKSRIVGFIGDPAMAVNQCTLSLVCSILGGHWGSTFTFFIKKFVTSSAQTAKRHDRLQTKQLPFHTPTEMIFLISSSSLISYIRLNIIQHSSFHCRNWSLNDILFTERNNDFFTPFPSNTI